MIRHCEPMTLKEIADYEGISHQAVAEILQRAFRKIKIELESQGIGLSDLLED